MFDARKFYRSQTDPIRDSYARSLDRLKAIREGTKREGGDGHALHGYLHRTSGLLLELASLEAELGDGYFEGASLEDLERRNNAFYLELLPAHYTGSYANPARCVELFGDGPGQALSYLYTKARECIPAAYRHKIQLLGRVNEVLIDLAEAAEKGSPETGMLREMVIRLDRPREEDQVFRIREVFDPAHRFFAEVVENADLDDVRLLYRYGSYVSPHDQGNARFLSRYSPEKIGRLAAQTAHAYLRGFERSGKSHAGKATYILMSHVGLERILRPLIGELRRQGLEPAVVIQGSQPNRQYPYDHRFDMALFVDEDHVRASEGAFAGAAESCRELMETCSGVVQFGSFGRPPFHPEEKPECLRLSEAQQRIWKESSARIAAIQNRYYSREKTSFSMISFPDPEIGDGFEAIFEDVLAINMLESPKYEVIQQRIIDALDQADSVHIVGKGGNRTDLRVRLRELSDPAHESNFVNCGADVNIPVGEVFTSPRLTGTHGTLHVAEAFLGGLRYVDLTLVFEDGYVTAYTCRNFSDEEQNRRYVYENLMMPHQTLPMGEFAIGTNTLAYVCARKHGIIGLLPVLILEKMGPHIAIGDTCFVFQEDRPQHNPDGKEVTARENEKTARRAADLQEAYTFRHTDITIPYDSLGRIAAVLPGGGTIDVIRDGRFVLAGTEELNEPFGDAR